MTATFVQGNLAGTSGLATASVTLPQSVGLANGVLVSVTIGAATIDSMSVTDDKGNTYTAVDTGLNTSGGVSLYTFYALNLINSPKTITATDSTSNRAFIIVTADEFAGITTLDGHSLLSQTSGNTGTDATTSGTYTTTGNNDLVWGIGVSAGAVNITKGTIFSFAGSNDVDNGFTTEYEIQAASSGSTAATFTIGAADNTIAASMAFLTNQIVGRWGPDETNEERERRHQAGTYFQWEEVPARSGFTPDPVEHPPSEPQKMADEPAKVNKSKFGQASPEYLADVLSDSQELDDETLELAEMYVRYVQAYFK